MSKIINTNECERCEYGTVDDFNKARVMIYCSDKKKKYFFGQCVPCENFKKKKGGD